MLPTILSDALCSLQENRTRFAFTMDVLINTDNNNIEKINYVNTSIIVNRNLCYETNEMLTNPIYQQTLKLVKNLNNKKNIQIVLKMGMTL